MEWGRLDCRRVCVYEFAGSNVQVRTSIYNMDYSGRFLSSPPIAAVPLLVSLARALRPLLSAFEYTLIPASNVSERDQLFLKALFGWVVKEKKNPPRKESIQRQHQQGMHRAVARFIQTIYRTSGGSMCPTPAIRQFSP